jgi:SsrA-binding protein
MAKPTKTQEFHAKKILATNKRAFHAYHIEQRFEAGIQLSGSEAKSLSVNPINLRGSFVSVWKNEVWLEQATIPVYKEASWTNHAENRKRKLLLHRKQITTLQKATEQKGMTIVPLTFYRISGKYKVEIGVAQGKKIYDKRQTIRERDSEIEAQRTLKNVLKRR